MQHLFDDDVPLFAVGLVAGMLDVQPAFLRRIDVEQVVRPARSVGGQRRYSRTDIERVQRVSDMASEGMTLASIRRILTLESEVADLKRQLQLQDAERGVRSKSGARKGRVAGSKGDRQA